LIRPYPSPNFDDRPPGAPIDALILHYTGMATGAEALARLADAEAKVSAHYCVDEDGTVFAMVDEAKRAWHAGLSDWAGRSRLNDVSVGIEIINTGHSHGLKPFPEVQIAAVISLSREIMARHGISQARVLAHSDIAPTRKSDPGELFPWAELAHAGVGLWLEAARRNSFSQRPPLITAQRLLAQWGYAVVESGALDVATASATAAFQRRFRPRRVDGVFDAECGELLTSLLDQCSPLEVGQ
jgi:N-acetylmuramoyl-L-alanine amidase